MNLASEVCHPEHDTTSFDLHRLSPLSLPATAWASSSSEYEPHRVERWVLVEGATSARPLPSWSKAVVVRLDHLLSLPENWDSYGAKAISLGVVREAFSILAEVMADSTPAPQIVPAPDGGLQLEWHQSGIDLEVEVSDVGEILVSFEDSQSGQEWEKALSDDHSVLSEAVHEITTRSKRS